jgi:ubiquinone biosynthesis protein UbiJ
MINPDFAWAQPLAAAGVARLTLVLNHVLYSEPAATQRLKPHAGRVLEVGPEGWPGWLPPWPRLVFQITPAGLLEWQGEAMPASGLPEPDLKVVLDATNPIRLGLQMLGSPMGMGRPPMRVVGDAALAADISWLADHLRWDIQDDLARLLGDAPAHELSRLGQGIREALRGFVSGLASWAGQAAAGNRSPASF